MQIVRRRIRWTALLLALGALLLVGLTGATALLVFRSGDTFRQIAVERDLRLTSGDLLSALQDAETGQRGYLITLDDDFLGPWRDATERIPGLRGGLERFVALTTEEALGQLLELDRLIEKRLAIIDETLRDARAGDVDRARRIVGEGEGRAAMDAIRVILNGFIDRSDARLTGAIAAQETLNARTQVLTVVAGLAMLAVVGGAFLTMVRQLRALREADLALRGANAGLEDRVRLRTKDLIRANQEVQRFAYIVTHDLRAPLVNIMGFTSELEAAMAPIQAYVLAEGEPLSEHAIREARTAASEDLPEALGFIRASTRKMDGLINAILKISRDGRRELRPESIDIEALLRQAVDAVAHQLAEAGGETVVDARVSHIVSDRMSIEQAVGNLVDNAVKYAARDRPLRLTLRAARESARMVAITVEDNGRGIAAADSERVFELFRRAGAQDRPGEGIGLAHVRTLVRNLGGEIAVRSTQGEGSAFTLTVPADLSQVMGVAKT